MRLDTHGKTDTIFYKGDNFCDFPFPILNIKPFLILIRGLLYEDRISFHGSKFSPLKIEHFSEDSKNKFDKVISLESVSIPLKVFFLVFSENKAWYSTTSRKHAYIILTPLNPIFI